MPRSLKVLFVDDDQDDVALERSALRRDFEVEGVEVDTAERFSEALRTGSFDVVLCDYSMPRFTGIEALELWKAAGATIPFVFVTGRLSEEVAVDCIKAGATDYVLKANLARLPAAVDRALREFAAARALRQVEAERARVVAAIEQTEEVVLITDPQGTVVYVNPAFARVTGYHPEDIIGQTPRLLKSGKQAPDFYAEMWQRILSGQSWSGGLINRRRDGTLYDAELTIAPVLDASGRIVNFCAIQRDVSARVAAERQLRMLHTQLAETDRLKDQFLAAFSHELRTPLNVILGYSDLLTETCGRQLDEEPRRFLERIIWSANHLTTLINETLDLARLRVDALRPQLHRVDVAALVEDVAESFTPMASAKGLTLAYSVAPRTLVVTTDAARLRQILNNLIDNAIKFTQQGEVRVRMAGDDDSFAVEVRDTGIGIGADDLVKIFEDFRQVDGSSTRLYGGCGLGLALSRRLVLLLGGSIEVDSTLGQGSCFRIHIPPAPTESVR